MTQIRVGTKPIAAAAKPAVGLLLAMLLTSCGGGDGSVDVPSPSESVTGSLPSPTRTPTRSPSLSPSESPSPSDSPTASESPTTSEPPTTSESPTTSEPPTESESPASEPTETESTPPPPAEDEPDATESDEEQGIPSWLWWVLAGLGLLGATLAAILVPRSRRRSAWDTDLATQQDEVAWFARELVPALQQAGSPDAVAGGWQVAAARVTRAEDQLTGLESTAPDVARGSRARSLRDAVRAARQGIEQVIVSRDPAALPRDLGAIGNQLQTALEPVHRTVEQ